MQQAGTVPALVGQWVSRTPEAEAVADARTGASLTYAELWRRSGRFAGELAAAGVGRGDVVGVTVPRSPELVVAVLGILRAGAAYLPVDPQAPPGRVATILGDAGARVVAGPPAANLPSLPVPDAGGGPAAPEVELTGEDVAYVCSTSGSTGTPKGVLVPHRAVRRLATGARFCTLGPGDRVANTANPAFDATTFELWNTLGNGATVVVLPTVAELPPPEWARLARDARVSAAFLTTSLFHAAAREHPAAFGFLDTLVVGGEQLDLGAVREVLAHGAPGRLVNGYGPTETTTFATFFDCTPESLAGLDRIPIGFALQETTLAVVGEDGEPVAAGETGELLVGGAGVALGYLGRPDLTAERFVSDETGAPSYRTGDLVRELPGGALELVGRRDRQVKLRGYRIELEEIEKAAAAVDGVAAVFVEKVGDGPSAWLAGFVLPAAGGGPGPAELSAALGRVLPAYMVPARWIVLDEVPLGATGKADRAALLASLDRPPGSPVAPPGPAAGSAAGVLGRPSGEPPRSSGEPAGDVLERAWREVLGVTGTPADANFLDLGGNSILAMQVASRVRSGLGIVLEPADVLLAESFGELATRVRELQHP
ncbi:MULTISPECIES: non-ribosomal peptide synthetase [unclassified Amycolatopsis]|uniref:non-ribosomal peptide synthetase n=1 Tax=unclassified Amycolatopsis TaxID=2618356 RepID=UPI00287B9A98|nr:MULTISPECIES: non-ribosomal peptide synthetase [unclassified Amycolatopsis]